MLNVYYKEYIFVKGVKRLMNINVPQTMYIKAESLGWRAK